MSEAVAETIEEPRTALRTEMFKGSGVFISSVEEPEESEQQSGIEFHVGGRVITVPFTPDEWLLIQSAIRKSERLRTIPAKTTPLTMRQKEVLNVLWAARKTDDVAPTVREIAGDMGLSPATIQQHLQELEKKGKLTLTGRIRGIVLKGQQS
jgi:DNA-binding transcriptional ArsR family regulator